MNDTIRATAEIEIQAATGDKPARVRIIAYTGQPMTPQGFARPVLLAVDGIESADRIPLLLDHENRTSAVAGSGSASVEGGSLIVEGTISRNSDAGRLVLALAGDGIPLQASIGATITSQKFVKAGETITANGAAHTSPEGGMLFVSKAKLSEVSIVALGADGATSISVAASKGNSMTTENTTDPVQVERDRIKKIEAACSGEYGSQSQRVAELRAKAIDEEIGFEALQAELLACIRASRGPAVPNYVRGGSPTSTRDTLEAGLLIRAGREDVAVKAFGEQVVEGARRSRVGSLVEVCAAALRLEGRDVPHGHDAIIRAAWSTAALPTILENTVGRSLVAAYMDATSDWRSFATVKSAADFRPQKAVQPASIEVLDELGAGGEIKHGTLNEENVLPWSIATFAKMLSITRKEIINDDLGFVADLAPALGRSAARSLNDLFWSTIVGGEAANFYHNDNGNLLTTGSELAVGSLGTAVATMRAQRDSRGYDIQMSPVALCVPPTLEMTARALLNSAEILGTSGVNGNPVRGIVPNLVVESRLENDDRFAGADDAAYYLFAGPMTNAIIVGFLAGKSTPTVETQDADFNKLGLQMRVYFDYGVALGDPKASLKCDGTGGG